MRHQVPVAPGENPAARGTATNREGGAMKRVLAGGRGGGVMWRLGSLMIEKTKVVTHWVTRCQRPG